jgi:N-acetylglucosamine repressor
VRKINTRTVQRATRTTQRDINRRILLNLIRDHQPISRADLARRMNVSLGAIKPIMDELLDSRTVVEGGTANTPRGRKPTMLHIRTRDRYAVAVDVRLGHTTVALTDFDFRQLTLETLETPSDPRALVERVAATVAKVLNGRSGTHEGVGVIVPGMVDRRTGRVVYSPQLGWRDVDIRQPLAEATGLRVMLENAPTACAIGEIWFPTSLAPDQDSFAYVAVSDGVGTGLVLNGELVRGHKETAGEFGHLPLDINGPRCLCGLRGCLEAYTSNLATLARYRGWDYSDPGTLDRLRQSELDIVDLIRLAARSDEGATEALLETARYLGYGLAGVITAFSPAGIIVGGEITGAWELIGEAVQRAVRERTLTEAARSTPILPASTQGASRLRGATSLLVALSFRAPDVI